MHWTTAAGIAAQPAHMAAPAAPLQVRRYSVAVAHVPLPAAQELFSAEQRASLPALPVEPSKNIEALQAAVAQALQDHGGALLQCSHMGNLARAVQALGGIRQVMEQVQGQQRKLLFQVHQRQVLRVSRRGISEDALYEGLGWGEWGQGGGGGGGGGVAGSGAAGREVGSWLGVEGSDGSRSGVRNSSEAPRAGAWRRRRRRHQQQRQEQQQGQQLETSVSSRLHETKQQLRQANAESLSPSRSGKAQHVFLHDICVRLVDCSAAQPL